MNSKLNLLHPYPFAKMAALLKHSTPASNYQPIKLGIGEPKHPPPNFVVKELQSHANRVQNYPTTHGLPELRQAIALWLMKRFQLASIDNDTQIIPVMGTREAIFSFVQAVIEVDVKASTAMRSTQQKPIVVMPNPFYQIYEGATLLAGAEPYYVNCDASNDFKGDYTNIPDEILQRTQLVFVCSPNNPTGAVMDESAYKALIELADKYNFIIASDECYSELYFDTPPLGLLEVCKNMGRHDYSNCVVFHSLSKRSNLPGLRSGFIAGDANLLMPYLQYRTYQGCAQPIHHQQAAIVAWQDEAHVEANRAMYREKFKLWINALGLDLNLRQPDAGFYLWVHVPNTYTDEYGAPDDEAFIKALYEQLNIHALAGRYLSRDIDGVNPGKGFVRLALVASVTESKQAIERIKTLFI